MALVRLIYFSSVAATTTEIDVLEIVGRAKASNLNAGITGALVMSKRHFLQVLEGGQHEVSQLIFSISQDRRHYDVTLVSFEEIANRMFEDWSMALFSLKDVDDNSRVLKHSASINFDPLAMRPASLLSLLKDLTRPDYPGRIFQL